MIEIPQKRSKKNETTCSRNASNVTNSIGEHDAITIYARQCSHNESKRANKATNSNRFQQLSEWKESKKYGTAL
jgi:hypothetical protein